MGYLEDRARKIAMKAHEGQVDKAGKPYIEHVERVVARLDDERTRAVGWLHDVMEDCGYDVGRLITSGIPSDIATAVAAVSRRPDEDPDDYYLRVSASPLARAVKAADIADNANPLRLAQLDPETREALERKYARARVALGLD